MPEQPQKSVTVKQVLAIALEQRQEIVVLTARVQNLEGLVQQLQQQAPRAKGPAVNRWGIPTQEFNETVRRLGGMKAALTHYGISEHTSLQPKPWERETAPAAPEPAAL